MQFEPGSMTMTEIIRLQTLLSQELSRRFEINTALVFSDIVGSTPYFARFGDEVGRQLQQLHLDLVEQVLPAHQGRIVSLAGDGAFAVFPTAMAAAEATVALMQEVSHQNESRTRDHLLALRVGVHWGRALSDGEQVTGDAVNLCARIAASALPGQLRVSRDLFQELTSHRRLQCRPLGPVQLKGIGRDIELLALEWRDLTSLPTVALIRETGQKLPLPAQDIIAFGRLEMIEGMVANDVVLALTDANASRQISRWHFELRRRGAGYVLRAVSNQPTIVDGQALNNGDEVPVRPGTTVVVSDVMTLSLLAPTDTHASGDATSLVPRS